MRIVRLAALIKKTEVKYMFFIYCFQFSNETDEQFIQKIANRCIEYGNPNLINVFIYSVSRKFEKNLRRIRFKYRLSIGEIFFVYSTIIAPPNFTYVKYQKTFYFEYPILLNFTLDQKYITIKELNENVPTPILTNGKPFYLTNHKHKALVKYINREPILTTV